MDQQTTSLDASQALSSQSVVSRLRARLREARELGFRVRQEFLDGQPGSWCEIAGRKTVFLDSSQSAAEQLIALENAIRTYRPAA